MSTEKQPVSRVARRKIPSRRPRVNLTTQVIGSLRQQIVNGDMKPGDQLPTEPKLIDAFGVSRTVIREAIAGLSADGLVEARHGVGVFVLEPGEATNIKSLFTVDADRTSSILEALELRAAVEIEAAGLAAVRRSPAQEARIAEAFEALRLAVQTVESVAVADLEFHNAIAEATNNASFRTFLEFVAQQTISRSEDMGYGVDAASELQQTKLFIAEHLAILVAISAQNAQKARQAMRDHLTGSRERIVAHNRAKSVEK